MARRALAFFAPSRAHASVKSVRHFTASSAETKPNGKVIRVANSYVPAHLPNINDSSIEDGPGQVAAECVQTAIHRECKVDQKLHVFPFVGIAIPKICDWTLLGLRDVDLAVRGPQFAQPTKCIINIIADLIADLLGVVTSRGPSDSIY